MAEHTTSITIEISDQFILDTIIDMAGYGINYWAVSAEIDEEQRTYTVEDEDGSVYAIGFDQLANVFLLLATGQITEVRDDIIGYAASTLRELQDPNEQYPGGDLDANVADVIVQIAALGEVVYG